MSRLLVLLSVACAPSGATFGLSRADAPADVLVFNNGSEPEYLDPSQATGHPDARIIATLFDGLTEYHPETLAPEPGLAERWDTHPDGRGYTFHLRSDARWSDGQPVTAHDVLWGWVHVLEPVHHARYAQQLYMVERAEAYNQGRALTLTTAAGALPAGAHVEAIDSTLRRLTADVKVDGVAVPAGTTVRLTRLGASTIAVREGCLDATDLPALRGCTGATHEGPVDPAVLEPTWPLVEQRVVDRAVALLDDEGAARAQLAAGDEVVRTGEVDGPRAKVFASASELTGWVPADALRDPREGVVVRVRALPPIDWEGGPDAGAADAVDATDAPAVDAAPVEADVPLSAVSVDPAILGIRADDDHTLTVRLRGTAPYFLTLTSHTTLRPASRRAWEAHGSRWTRPEHIVTNGPFRLVTHAVRDRFVLERSEDWWGAADVPLRRIEAYSIDNQTTSVNLYRAGYTDLVVAGDIPGDFVPMLQDRTDYQVGPALSVYFYRLNTTEPPLDDARVRRALSMAIDRTDIVKVTKAGQLPATHIVPPGMPGYGDGVPGPGFDPEAARALLAEAGFPNGEGFPEISILYNTLESHKLIAAVVQDQWRRHLGITVQLENREWKTYLKAVHAKEYQVARAGWIGDYVDPLTFLELWITDGGNNETGWSSPAYDALIVDSSRTPDPEARLALLREAEAMLNEQMPFIPIYHYVWYELTQPDVVGWKPNVLDQHPLQRVSLQR